MLFTRCARTVGIVSALGIVGFTAIYGAVLIAGLRSLQTPDQPIGDPYFTIMEVLILLLMPLIVALMAALHAFAPPSSRSFTLIGLVFAGLLTAVTSSVHFVILTLSRQPAFARQPWLPLLVSFHWPSLAYALDILAWDIFFPLSVLSAQQAFAGFRPARAFRAFMTLSGLLALAGLSGIFCGDMRLRNIGVVGYVLIFPLAMLLLARLFWNTEPQPN